MDNRAKPTDTATGSPQALTPDISKLRFGDIMRAMTSAQLWSFLGGGAAVLVASFVFGFTVKSWNTQGAASQSSSEIAKREVEIAELESDLSDAEARWHELATLHSQLEAKENFLRVYYLYSRAQWTMDYQQTMIAQMWRGLDFQIGIDAEESPARSARAYCGNSFPTEKFPNTSALRTIFGEYRRLASERRHNRMGTDLVFEKVPSSVLALDKAVLDRDRHKGGLKILLDEHRKSPGYEVELGHFAKGVSDIGVIKFAYDGTEIPLPNELFPEPEW